MSTLLQTGSRGPRVKELQQLLNAGLSPTPKLAEDGIFGPKTREAVLRFQNENWLVADGIAGLCTLNALRGTEAFVLLKPPPHLIPQPTQDTCWAAATAMLTGMTVPGVVAKAKAAGVDIAGGLSNDSDQPDFANTSRFARAFGLTMLPPMSWLPQALADQFSVRGPLMMDTLWDVGEYAAGHASSGHMRVIAGMRGDGTDVGTTLLIYDPWAPTKGAIYPVIYGPFIRKTPASTYQLFYL